MKIKNFSKKIEYKLKNKINYEKNRNNTNKS